MTAHLLIFHLRPARLKARLCATAEALCLLDDLQPSPLKGGPLSELGGVFWIEIPASSLEPAIERLPRLGYSFSVDSLEPFDGYAQSPRKSASSQVIRWRGSAYRLIRIYEEDAVLLREAAPDRRSFSLETPEGEIRPVRGYRGDSGPLSRRGLAVYDARMLVNLVHCPSGATFLDPFAGAGGIVIEAQASGYRVLSADIDQQLRPGLEGLGAKHYVADARQLPIDSATIDAIATEPPFGPLARPAVVESLAEFSRLLKPGGRLAMLCAAEQAGGLRKRASELGFRLQLDENLDRKGMQCTVLAWEK